MSYIAVVTRACDISVKRKPGVYLNGSFPVQIKEYSFYDEALLFHNVDDVYSIETYFEMLRTHMGDQKKTAPIAVIDKKGFMEWLKILFHRKK